MLEQLLGSGDCPSERMKLALYYKSQFHWWPASQHSMNLCLGVKLS